MGYSDGPAPRTRVIASPATWIEGEAIRQLEDAAKLAGMRRCVGLPDLHPGKGSPIGAAFLADTVHPALVGSDIGCGMALWTTDCPVRKARPERLAAQLDGLDRPWDGDVADWLARRGLVSSAHDTSCGTPGHGNHFIEIQRVHTVEDAAAFAALGLHADRLVVVVHSGSRGLGEAIFRAHAAQHGAAPLTDDAAPYLAAHGQAVRWAAANRDLCAERTLAAMRASGRRVLDICHNSVSAVHQDGCRCWLHRKGAAPADQGPVVIPGSRGDLSYLVQPVPGHAEALYSLAHGAGRKLARHEARAKLRGRYRRADLTRNRFGGRVVCGDDNLAWEEAPECYKPIASVIDALLTAGLIEIIATFEPLVTFKTSEGASRSDGLRPDEPAWKRARRAAREARQ